MTPNDSLVIAGFSIFYQNCQSGISTGVTNYTNDGPAPCRCPSKPCWWPIMHSSTRVLELKHLNACLLSWFHQLHLCFSCYNKQKCLLWKRSVVCTQCDPSEFVLAIFSPIVFHARAMADQVFIDILEYPVPMLRFHIVCFQSHACY